MIEHISERIVDRLLDSQMIDVSESEAYIYTYECLLEKAVSIIIVVIIGILCRHLMEGLVFMISFAVLRRRTGGYHCDSFARCMLISSIVYLICICCGDYLATYALLLFCISFICTVYIWIVGCVNHPDMDMSQSEYEGSVILARIALIGESAVIGFLLWGGLDSVAVYIEMAIIVCAMAVFIAKIKRQEV